MNKKLFLLLFVNLFFTFTVLSQFTVWQQEAETGELSGTSDVAQGCSNASGLAFVRILSNAGNGVRFNNINHPANDRKVSKTGVSDQESYGIFVHNNGNEVMSNIHLEDLIVRKVFAVSTEGIDFDALKVHGIRFYTERNTVAGKEKNIRDVLVEKCYVTLTGKFGMGGGHGGGDSGIGNDSLNRNMNFVFRNNHTYHTGGSGIMPGAIYNCLVEHNTFENTGSNIDPRMAARGSGAWFYNSRNVIAQFNRSLHVRGPADSYSMHIDFGNRNVILQYNNSIYVTNGVTPDISIEGKNTYIFNNIFYADSTAVIGQAVDVKTETGSQLYVSNNLYAGNVRAALTDRDLAPIFGNPLFTNKGLLDKQGYKLNVNSPALSAGKIFQEPPFPEAGKGFFKDISIYSSQDLFGNEVSINTQASNIGAFNGISLQETSVPDISGTGNGKLYFLEMPVFNNLKFNYTSPYNSNYTIEILNMEGKTMHTEEVDFNTGENSYKIPINKACVNGFYFLKITNKYISKTKKFVLVK